MIPLSERQLLANVALLPVFTERFEDGTLRFEFHRRYSCRDIDVSDLGLLAFSRAYLVGKTAQPPLRDEAFDPADPVAMALAQHRALQFDAATELHSAVCHLANLGWCVDNDAYVFDAEGRWMLHVSHHDTVTLYERHA